MKKKTTFLIIEDGTNAAYTPEEWAEMKGIKHIKAKLNAAHPDCMEKVLRVSSSAPFLYVTKARKAKTGIPPSRVLVVSEHGVAFTRDIPEDWSMQINLKNKTYITPDNLEPRAIEWTMGKFYGTRRRKEAPDVLL